MAIVRSDVLTRRILYVVVAVAAVVRLWNIGSVPAELHPDEMAGYLGVRDMLAGRTPWTPFIDYRVLYLPLYGVFEVLSTTLFGTSIASLRVPAAFLGVATTVLTGALAWRFERSRATFVLGAATMAILPWDISIARLGWEPAATLPFLLGGLSLLWRGLEERRDGALVLGFVVLAIGAYSYRAETFDAAWLGATLLVAYAPTLRSRVRALGLGFVAAAVVVAPLVVAFSRNPAYFSSGPAQTTFGAGVNPTTLGVFFDLYRMHFATDALFALGDGNLQHGPPLGVLYWWMLPFLVLGVAAVTIRGNAPRRIVLWSWIVLYPFGGALTDDGRAHFIRTLVGAPLACVICAVGLHAAYTLCARSLALRRVRTVGSLALALVVVMQFAAFAHVYFDLYPDESAEIFHYGDRDIFAYVRAHETDYARVCFTALDGWNYPADIEYYLAGDPIRSIEGLDSECAQPGSLLVLGKIAEAPAGAHLVATVQKRDGTIRAWFFAR